jgi:uncharacterized Zn finger protein
VNMSNFNNPSLPRKATGGIKARSESGEFSRNWWARRWIEAMERLVLRARLQRGQRYARMGQVLSLEENKGGVVAMVQGSRARPYKVTLQINPLSPPQWEKVIDVLSGEAIFAAQLLAGEMPGNIEDAFSAAGISLFPTHMGDLKTSCTCPDWANPCKHVAAVHYILGDRFDEDPFLIFRLRGMTQTQIMDSLRRRRSGEAPSPSVVEEDNTPETESFPRLRETMDCYWEIPGDLDTFGVSVKPPTIPLPILKRLGEADFAHPIPMEELVGDAYQTISQFALAMAFAGVDIEIPPVEDEET